MNNCSIFWVRGDSAAHFLKSYKEIAMKADFESILNGDELLGQVQRWIEGLPDWLVIMDNVDDLAEERVGHLNFVPKPHQTSASTSTGAVLWTTRDKGLLDEEYGPRQEAGIDASLMQRSESCILYRRLLKIGSDNLSNTIEPDKT